MCSFGDATKGGNEGWHTLDQARADLGIEVKFSCHDETLIQNPETKEIVGAYTYWRRRHAVRHQGSQGRHHDHWRL